ncbi:MAG: S-methyl-5-thioribose-1-phosphate isomerase [Chloroflexi bacterium]|nr:S-methyl-5-thioribose-1-phosphate isomerase [Chloroflexota bacterium]
MAEVEPLRVLPGRRLEVLDQTLLPSEERYVHLAGIEAVCEAIRSLRVRGAPLLGLIGAYGMAVAASTDASGPELRAAAEAIIATRPTAADLAKGVHRALAVAGEAAGDPAGALWKFASEFARQRAVEDRAMAALGASLLRPGDAVLTHCNTGALATGGIGTALGVIRAAHEAGVLSHCYATETRPLLQGARLTMWELMKLGIPATLLPDTAAATLIASGRVQAVITGADRIAANGDTANKVGTYGLALAAARHGIPFLIVAPSTTFDPACPDGSAIPIEFRAGDEVGGFAGVRWSPAGGGAFNPAFDVTPGALITAIVSERGIARPPYGDSIAALGIAPEGRRTP